MSVPVQVNLTRSILIQLIVYCLAMGISLSGLPLSANQKPTEDLAVHLLVCLHMVALAGLAPLVLSRWINTLLAVILVWPYLLLSAFVAARPVSQLIGVAIIMGLWTLVLGAWQNVLKTDVARSIMVALALLATLGASVLNYLSREYQPASLGWPSWHWWTATPLLAGLKQLDQPLPLIWPALVVLLALLAGALAIAWLQTRATVSNQ